MKKLNRKGVTSPSTFKKTCPCTILSPLFKIFQVPLAAVREVIKTYFPHLKKGEVEGVDYVSLHTSWLISVIIRKKAFSFVNSDLELDFHRYIYIRVQLNSKTAAYVNKLILTLFSPLDIKCRNLMQKTYGNVFLGHLGWWVFHVFPRLHSILGNAAGTI